LWILAYPRALLLAKQFPFWYSVASLAQTGCLNNDHIQMLSGEQGKETPDLVFDGILAPLLRTFKRTSTQNLWIASIGKVLTLAALYLLQQRGGRPWHALIVDGIVMAFVIFNGHKR
jgi:hypothetical protein